MKNEKELRKHRCCFTGHRPEKLDMEETEAKALMRENIEKAITHGYRTFISGMARGFDMWAAEVVIEMKKKHPQLRLIAAVPFKDFHLRWENDGRQRFSEILNNSDLVQYVSEHYSFDCYQKRNEWMVNHSSLVIALCNGQKSGTLNTIKYAEKANIPVINIYN